MMALDAMASVFARFNGSITTTLCNKSWEGIYGSLVFDTFETKSIGSMTLSSH